MGYSPSKDRLDALYQIMFQKFGATPADRFLRQELERYAPKLMPRKGESFDEERINQFADYHRAVYIHGDLPVIGKPIGFLNPTFHDDLEKLRVRKGIFMKASTKENGYRMQVHIPGEGDDFACTRQFTTYDLRMLPELLELFATLPVMVGDAELINRSHEHLAGFNRVDIRLPNSNYWPEKGETTINEELFQQYINNPEIFKDGYPLPDLEMTLAFHGLLAIADPSTWDKSREEQLASVESLCQLPMNYQRVHELLQELDKYLQDNDLNARVAESQIIKSKKQLRAFREANKYREGIVIVQYDGTFKHAKSIKHKEYETIDAALQGIALRDPTKPIQPDNLDYAILGLWDNELGKYLPTMKVSLKHDSVQIKTEGQRERMVKIQQDLVSMLEGRLTEQPMPTLFDAYHEQGLVKMETVLNEHNIPHDILDLLTNLPRGYTLEQMMDMSGNDQYLEEGGLGSRKSHKTVDKAVRTYLPTLHKLRLLQGDKVSWREFHKYFSIAKKVATTSKKLPKVHILVDTEDPIIMESKAFDIKFGKCPYPARWHSWFRTSYQISNCFPERIRHDKSTTTDYATIDKIAKKNTVDRYPEW